MQLYTLHLTRSRNLYLYTHAGLRMKYDLTGKAYRTSESGFRTRCAELVDAGLVADSGQRETLASGRKAVCWSLTSAGIEYIEHIRDEPS